MKFRPLASMLACCALALAACGGGSADDGSGDDLTSARKRVPCTQDNQCTSTQICSPRGYCITPPGCHHDSQCDVGLVCVNGHCNHPGTGTNDGGIGGTDAGVGGTDAGVGGTDAGVIGGGGDAGVGGACASMDECAGGGLCESGACVAMQCLHRASNKTGIRAHVQITRYQGLINGSNGTHEIAYGTMQASWVDVPSVVDTSAVQLALNVASSTDPTGLPHEIPLSAGESIEVEGEYISGATANAGGDAVIHFTHSTCGYVTIAGTTYQ